MNYSNKPVPPVVVARICEVARKEPELPIYLLMERFGIARSAMTRLLIKAGLYESRARKPKAGAR